MVYRALPIVHRQRSLAVKYQVVQKVRATRAKEDLRAMVSTLIEYIHLD